MVSKGVPFQASQNEMAISLPIGCAHKNPPEKLIEDQNPSEGARPKSKGQASRRYVLSSHPTKTPWM